MIRYLVILILSGYCFQLKIDLYKKTNSFSHLYDTCNKTSEMVSDLKTMIDSRNKYLGKLSYYKKNNEKLLYNYRICTSELVKREKKATLLANMISQ